MELTVHSASESHQFWSQKQVELCMDNCFSIPVNVKQIAWCYCIRWCFFDHMYAPKRLTSDGNFFKDASQLRVCITVEEWPKIEKLAFRDDGPSLESILTYFYRLRNIKWVSNKFYEDFCHVRIQISIQVVWRSVWLVSPT